jgi:hypothetical protein
MGRRERRCNQLLDDPKEKKDIRKLKQESLGPNHWRTRFGRGYGFVVRRTMKRTKHQTDTD